MEGQLLNRFLEIMHALVGRPTAEGRRTVEEPEGGGAVQAPVPIHIHVEAAAGANVQVHVQDVQGRNLGPRAEPPEVRVQDPEPAEEPVEGATVVCQIKANDRYWLVIQGSEGHREGLYRTFRAMREAVKPLEGSPIARLHPCRNMPDLQLCEGAHVASFKTVEDAKAYWWTQRGWNVPMPRHF